MVEVTIDARDTSGLNGNILVSGNNAHVCLQSPRMMKETNVRKEAG
jgi:hypothetical protein